MKRLLIVLAILLWPVVGWGEDEDCVWPDILVDAAKKGTLITDKETHSKMWECWINGKLISESEWEKENQPECHWEVKLLTSAIPQYDFIEPVINEMVKEWLKWEIFQVQLESFYKKTIITIWLKRKVCD